MKTLLEAAILCCVDLALQIDGEWHPVFIAPCPQHGYEPCVFIGTVEDDERELQGSLEELLPKLKVIKNY